MDQSLAPGVEKPLLIPQRRLLHVAFADVDRRKGIDAIRDRFEQVRSRIGHVPIGGHRRPLNSNDGPRVAAELTANGVSSVRGKAVDHMIQIRRRIYFALDVGDGRIVLLPHHHHGEA